MPDQVMFEGLWMAFTDDGKNVPMSKAEFLGVLHRQKDQYSPTGWFLAECQQLDSSHCGEMMCLAYGSNNTIKTPPEKPFSPRGLASDMSVVTHFMLVEDLPDAVEQD